MGWIYLYFLIGLGFGARWVDAHPELPDSWLPLVVTAVWPVQVGYWVAKLTELGIRW